MRWRIRQIELTVFTGLSLEKPRPGSEIEERFLGPFIERQFGSYEELDYMAALREGSLPPNVRVHEFYFRAGSMKGVAQAQRDYVSSNYTFASRDLVDRGLNVLVQLVASREIDGRRMLSLSSNTDTSLDLLPWLAAQRARGVPCMAIAQVHADMPFMYNRAMVEPECFDAVLVESGVRQDAVRRAQSLGGRHRLRDRRAHERAAARRRHAADRHRLARRRDRLRQPAAPARRMPRTARWSRRSAPMPALVERIGGLGRFETGPLRLQRDVRQRLPAPDARGHRAGAASTTMPACSAR